MASRIGETKWHGPYDMDDVPYLVLFQNGLSGGCSVCFVVSLTSQWLTRLVMRPSIGGSALDCIRLMTLREFRPCQLYLVLIHYVLKRSMHVKLKSLRHINDQIRNNIWFILFRPIYFMKPKSFGFQVVLNCEKRFNHHHHIKLWSCHIKKKLSILFGVNETLISFAWIESREESVKLTSVSIERVNHLQLLKLGLSILHSVLKSPFLH